MPTTVRVPDPPALRDSVLVFAIGEDRVQFVLTSDLRVVTYENDPFVSALVPLLDGRHDVAELSERLESVPGYADGRLQEALDVMADDGLLCALPGGWQGGDTPEQYRRYDRQLRLFADLAGERHPGLPVDPVATQDRLARAVVTVIGSGGAGSWTLMSLAAAGVGTLRVVDFDRVETSNLHRQLLYTEADLGRSKLEAGSERLLAINPAAVVQGYERRIDGADDLADVVSGCDLVVNCADRPTVTMTSDWVAGACHPRGIPHIVSGAYVGALGVLGYTVLPGRTVCWACVRDATADDHDRGAARPLRGSPASPGNVGAVCGVVGNLIAWEAIRVLTGLPPLLASSFHELDLMTLGMRARPIPSRAGCPQCPPSFQDPS